MHDYMRCGSLTQELYPSNEWTFFQQWKYNETDSMGFSAQGAVTFTNH